MGKFLGILAVVLVVYFVITRPVAAADTAEDIGGALATAAESLVVFADTLVGGNSDGTSATGSPDQDSASEPGSDVEGESSSAADGYPVPVPTSVPAGAADR